MLKGAGALSGPRLLTVSRKGKEWTNMNQKVVKLLRIVLFGVLIAAVGVVIWRQAEYAGGRADYDKAAELAGLTETAAPSATPSATPSGGPAAAEETLPPEEKAPIRLEDVDLAALQQVNSDVIGWISIPDTELSYPVLQGEDNQYYLNHTWRKQRNGVGAIYMDYRFDPGLTDFYTLIYGHRMHNATMFGSLARYDSKAYWEEHPSVYIAHEGGVNEYDIFAAFEASVDSDVYRRGFSQTEDRDAFISWCLEQSVIDTGVRPTAEGRIITLSTCTQSGGAATRWVVLASLAETEENSSAG